MGLLARLLGLGDGRLKSEERLVAYCRSGRVELIDSRFSNPNLSALGIEAAGDRLDLLVDYDRLEVPKTSGRIRIRLRTPEAALIAAELSSRIER